MQRAAAIFQNECAILRGDPTHLVTMVVMPLITMAVLKNALQPTLGSLGFAKTTGAEQVVPGMAVLFAVMQVQGVGFPFFREHFDNTWDRLRGNASRFEIYVGKLGAPWLSFVWQQVALWSGGVLLFGLSLGAHLGPVALIALTYTLALTALGLLTAAICRTQLQLHAINQLFAAVAGLSGTLVPLETLPRWSHFVAPALPPYWAMRGFTKTTLEQGGLGDVMPMVLALALFAAGFAALANAIFRFERIKTT